MHGGKEMSFLQNFNEHMCRYFPLQETDLNSGLYPSPLQGRLDLVTCFQRIEERMRKTLTSMWYNWINTILTSDAMVGTRLPNVTRRAFHLWGIPSKNSWPLSRQGITETNQQHQVKIHLTGHMASTAQDFQDRERERLRNCHRPEESGETDS